MRALLLLNLSLGFLPLASAQQPYIISTVAGIGVQPFSGSGGPALSAELVQPQWVAADQAGNVFVSDLYYNQVFRVSPDGNIIVYAGNATRGFSGDNGPATAAQLSTPQGLAVDAAGNLFIMDNGNGRLRKVTPDGTITTVAQVAGATLAMDKAGNFYVSQALANIIHKVTPAGVVSTFAGTGQPGSAGDGGMATAAQFYNPLGLAFDAAGNLFVADTLNNKIRMITPQGIVSTFAGNGRPVFNGDAGPAINASLSNPMDVKAGADGSVYISDNGTGRIRVVTPDGKISTIAGGGASFTDGPANQEALAGNYGIAIDNQGNVVVALVTLRQVRRVRGGNVNTIAGALPSAYTIDNQPATAARLLSPYGILVDSGGSIYVSDSIDERIRKITTDGTITTFAGDGLPGQSPDGMPAMLVGGPRALAIDQAGNFYVTENSVVRRIAPDGTIRTIAGSTPGFSGDQALAGAAQLSGPLGMAFDAQGNLYIADTFNNRIRRIDATSNVITTVAGTGATGYGGDNGPATAAMLYQPNGVAVDSAGNVFIADTFNNRLRKITPDGTITTIAGNGTLGFAGDGGDASAALLYRPTTVAVDAVGNLYLNTPSSIRMIDASTNIISTVAGMNSGGFGGDGGPATSAQLDTVVTLTLDNSGDIYVTDSLNYRVRKLTPAQNTP